MCLAEFSSTKIRIRYESEEFRVSSKKQAEVDESGGEGGGGGRGWPDIVKARSIVDN